MLKASMLCLASIRSCHFAHPGYGVLSLEESDWVEGDWRRLMSPAKTTFSLIGMKSKLRLLSEMSFPLGSAGRYSPTSHQGIVLLVILTATQWPWASVCTEVRSTCTDFLIRMITP